MTQWTQQQRDFCISLVKRFFDVFKIEDKIQQKIFIYECIKMLQPKEVSVKIGKSRSTYYYHKKNLITGIGVKDTAGMRKFFLHFIIQELQAID